MRWFGSLISHSSRFALPSPPSWASRCLSPSAPNLARRSPAVSLLVAALICVVAPELRAQSPVDDSASTPPERLPPASALPTGELANSPSRPGGPPLEVAEAVEDPQPPLVPASPWVDTLTGHLLVGFAGTLGTGFGSLDSDTSLHSLGTIPATARLDLTYGFTPSVALGLAGDFTGVLKNGCSDCAFSSYGAGPVLRYHLVQGTRFDPWLSLGIGIRAATITTADSTKSDYLGVDMLALGIGGDWYATSQLGFGPVMELVLSRFLDRPDGVDARTMGTLQFGLRVVFDTPGR